MRKTPLILVASIPCVLLTAPPAEAQQQPVSPSVAVTHFRQASARMAEVNPSVHAVNVAFRACRNGRLQVQFNGLLNRVELARQALETQRRKTEAMRRELEVARARLEADHQKRLKQYRGRKQDAAYVDAEQAYADGLANTYYKPLEEVLVKRMEDYRSAMSDYVAILERYSRFCASGGATATAGAALVDELTPAVNALAAKANGLSSPINNARHDSNTHRTDHN